MVGFGPSRKAIRPVLEAQTHPKSMPKPLPKQAQTQKTQNLENLDFP